MILCRYNIHIRRKEFDRGDVDTCRFCGDRKRLNWLGYNPDTTGRMKTRKRRRT